MSTIRDNLLGFVEIYRDWVVASQTRLEIVVTVNYCGLTALGCYQSL